MSSQNNRLKYSIHTRGHEARTKDDIFISMTPGAQQIKELVKPLLERSYDEWRQSGDKELLSAYNGDSIFILSYKKGSQSHQFAFTAEELDEPEFAQMKAKIEEFKMKATITKGGPFTVPIESWSIEA